MSPYAPVVESSPSTQGMLEPADKHDNVKHAKNAMIRHDVPPNRSRALHLNVDYKKTHQKSGV